jgi:addiction module HigA family antidote
MAAALLRLSPPQSCDGCPESGRAIFALKPSAFRCLVWLPGVNDIVREKRSISPEMAVLLSAYFGTSDTNWINLQAHFDLEMAKEKVGKQAARISPQPHGVDGTRQRI